MGIVNICKKCEKSVSADQLYSRIGRKGKRYYSPFCLDCFNKEQAIYRIKRAGQQKMAAVDKNCTKCKKHLSISEFFKNPCSKDGYSYECRDCSRTRSKNQREKIKLQEKPQINGKICPCCKIYKTTQNFSKCRSVASGLSSACKECSSRKRDKEKQRARERHLMKTDPVFRFSKYLRTRMKDTIKRQSKSAHSFELLGCTGAECMAYLETLFWPGMTKENYGRGGWVVDHIIPIDAFDKTDPNWQFKCFHYKNLQPLWRIDNESKNNRLDWSPTESRYELPERLKK